MILLKISYSLPTAYICSGIHREAIKQYLNQGFEQKIIETVSPNEAVIISAVFALQQPHSNKIRIITDLLKVNKCFQITPYSIPTISPVFAELLPKLFALLSISVVNIKNIHYQVTNLI